MNNKTLFSVSTIFHLMVSKLYIEKNGIKNPIIVCYAINPIIAQLVAQDQDFTEKLIIERNQNVKNKLKSGLKNKSNIKRVKNFINSYNIDQLITFKDNGIFNQAMINIAHDKNVKIILMEEGLGLYEDDETKIKKEKQNFIKKYIFSYPAYVLKIQGINSKVNEIVATSPDRIPEEKSVGKKIKKMNFDTFSKEQNIKLFEYFNINEFKLKFPLNNSDILILYLGQPFSEFNILTFKEEQKRLHKVFNTLATHNNIKVIIKPHPSENLKKYEGLVDDTSVKFFQEHHIPAELIPTKVRVDKVLTVHSSSCYYFNKWYGIESVSIYEIMFGKSPSPSLKEKITQMYNMRLLDDISSLNKFLLSALTNRQN